jgi:ribosomal protein L11 methyltransferase
LLHVTNILYIVKLMAAGFIKVSFITDVDSGELLSMLQGGEDIGCWEEQGAVHICWPENQWTPEALEDLKRILAVHGVDAQAAGLTIQQIPDEDWNASWAASLNPIRLGQRFRIRQSWHPLDTAFNGIELVIDPKRAFGTGYHATTQLVIEWLEENIRGEERVLDVGTGSGILSMAAIRLGAASALAIDNDPVAVECAQGYARANGFGSELDFRVASFEDCAGGSFDIVVANIDGRTLPLLCPVMPRLLRAGGVACFSGLLQEDYEEISQALYKVGFFVKMREARGEWLALTVSRK